MTRRSPPRVPVLQLQPRPPLYLHTWLLKRLNFGFQNVGTVFVAKDTSTVVPVGGSASVLEERLQLPKIMQRRRWERLRPVRDEIVTINKRSSHVVFISLEAADLVTSVGSRMSDVVFM